MEFRAFLLAIWAWAWTITGFVAYVAYDYTSCLAWTIGMAVLAGIWTHVFLVERTGG